MIFPELGLTKRDLADYYAPIEPLIMVDAADRPMTLIRCPQGRARRMLLPEARQAAPSGPHVKQIPIEEKDGDVEDYLYFDDIRGLLACVQMGTIEFHGWGSKVDKVEYPDRLVFDLDPDVGLDFDKVKAAAVRLQALLADLGLKSFPVAVRRQGHPRRRAARRIEATGRRSRASPSASAAPSPRPSRRCSPPTSARSQRKGRIFLDWLRNQRGATAVMPYSARAREGAPVSAPDRLGRARQVSTAAHHFTIRDADELLERAEIEAACRLGQGEASLAGCISCSPPRSFRSSSFSPPPRRPSSRAGAPRPRGSRSPATIGASPMSTGEATPTRCSA